MSCNGDCGGCASKTKFGADLFAIKCEKQFQPTREESLPTSAIVNITDECNNKCPYCFVHFNKNYMNYQTAKRTVEFLLENNRQMKRGIPPTFCFFGGEPLIRFNEIIKPLIEEYRDEIKWSITTNGTLLSENIIDFLAENNVSILLSWDGVKEVQDIQRPLKNGNSSYDEIMKNIHYLMLKIPNTCCRATVTKLNAPHIMDDMLLFEKIGARYCSFAVNEEEDWDDETFDIVKEEFTKMCLYVYKKLLRVERVIRINPIIDICQTLEEARVNPSFHNEWNRCGMGTTSIGVSYDGKLHPCQEENSSDKYIIGNVFDGIDFQSRNEYIKTYYSNMDNLSCKEICRQAIKYICFNGQCPNKIMETQGQISNTRCAYNRAIFYSIVRLHKLCRASVYPNIRDYFEEGAK